MGHGGSKPSAAPLTLPQGTATGFPRGGNAHGKKRPGLMEIEEAAEKIDFSGVTTSVVSQIRAATGLVEVCVVANSFGAGVVLWDFAALSADPGVRFVLISPTELYMPASAGLPPDSPLPRTLLAADPERDPFFNTPAARQYLTERANAALPPDYNPVLPSMTHLIIGQHPTSLPYVFSLIDSVYEQP